MYISYISDFDKKFKHVGGHHLSLLGCKHEEQLIFLDVHKLYALYFLQKTFIQYMLNYKEGSTEGQIIFLVRVGDADLGQEHLLCRRVLVHTQIHADYNDHLISVYLHSLWRMLSPRMETTKNCDIILFNIL